MSDRDTHFARFGVLLWREIEQAKKDAAHERDPFAVVGFDAQLCTLIARRAYDFACHVISTHELVYESTARALVSDIPDMTTLPKEDERD